MSYRNFYRNNPRMPYGFDEHEQYVRENLAHQILRQLPSSTVWRHNHTRILKIDGFDRYVRLENVAGCHWVAIVTPDEHYAQVNGEWTKLMFDEERVNLTADSNWCDLSF